MNVDSGHQELLRYVKIRSSDWDQENGKIYVWDDFNFSKIKVDIWSFKKSLWSSAVVNEKIISRRSHDAVNIWDQHTTKDIMLYRIQIPLSCGAFYTGTLRRKYRNIFVNDHPINDLFCLANILKTILVTNSPWIFFWHDIDGGLSDIFSPTSEMFFAMFYHIDNLYTLTSSFVSQDFWSWSLADRIAATHSIQKCWKNWSFSIWRWNKYK